MAVKLGQHIVGLQCARVGMTLWFTVCEGWHKANWITVCEGYLGSSNVLLEIFGKYL